MWCSGARPSSTVKTSPAATKIEKRGIRKRVWRRFGAPYCNADDWISTGVSCGSEVLRRVADFVVTDLAAAGLYLGMLPLEAGIYGWARASQTPNNQKIAMKLLATLLIAPLATTIVLLASAGTASAAHESNNSASLSAEDSSAGGKAIVNYIAGQESWAANARVEGLEEGTYTFAVRLNDGAPQPVCTFVVDARGNGSCSNNHFDLAGFNIAVILDDSGDVVLSGTFARRGGNREKG